MVDIETSDTAKYCKTVEESVLDWNIRILVNLINHLHSNILKKMLKFTKNVKPATGRQRPI